MALSNERQELQRYLENLLSEAPTTDTLEAGDIAIIFTGSAYYIGRVVEKKDKLGVHPVLLAQADFRHPKGKRGFAPVDGPFWPLDRARDIWVIQKPELVAALAPEDWKQEQPVPA